MIVFFLFKYKNTLQELIIHYNKLVMNLCFQYIYIVFKFYFNKNFI